MRNHFEPHPVLYLASRSPRRVELLKQIGINFEMLLLRCDPRRGVDVDETPLDGEAAEPYVRRICLEKARVGSESLRLRNLPSFPVLAADTTVALGEDLLGKPADPAEARRILERLRGRTHTVLTALALVRAPDPTLESELCVSPVRMRAYSDDEIEAYIRSGDPFDKAGGYAIQNLTFHPVADFYGCAASVMGLPLCHLARLLLRCGITPPADIPTACQAHLDYTCTIFAAVLRGEEAG